MIMNPSRLIGIVGVIESVDQSKRSSLPINITPLASKMFLIAFLSQVQSTVSCKVLILGTCTRQGVGILEFDSLISEQAR